MPALRAVPLLLPALLLFGGAAPLPAQAAVGTVVDSAGGSPVSGALVVLLDRDGRTRAGALSNAAGRFSVQAPAPGTYRLRAERVGMAVALSPELALAAGQTREERIVLAAAPVPLDRVTVAGGSGRRCASRPQDGAQTAAVWEEARKALTSAAWAQEGRLFQYAASLYRRELDPGTLQVRDETRRSESRLTRHPFASLPADTLERQGYVRRTAEGTFYYAPDPAVLLSPAFLDGHCFRLAEPPPGEEALVGLAFEPARGRRLPDVEGTLWLDRKSSELRRLEYRYRNLDASVPTDRVGGHAEFERLPTGAWIVRRWWIRMPAVLVEQTSRRLHEGMGVEQRQRERLAGLREEGGEVTSVLAGDGSPLVTVRHAALAGVVYDSTRAAPLAGATVFVSGTALSARTGPDGRFRIEGVPPGEYAVSFFHPRLDTLDAAVAPRRVTVVDTGDAAVELGVPRTRVAASASAAEGGAPVPLPGLRATGQPRDALIAGFYRRAASGGGSYVTRAEIARLRATSVAELFRRIPAYEVIGNRVRLRAAGNHIPRGQSALPLSMEGTGRTAPAPGGTPEAAKAREVAGELDTPADCVPSIFLDGTAWDPPGGDLSSLRPDEIEGIEAYPRGGLAPPRYRGRGNDCGVILVWLRQRQ